MLLSFALLVCVCDLSTCFVEACLYVYCQVAVVGECQYDAYFTLLPTGTTLACPFAFVYASVVFQALSVVEYFHFSFVGWASSHLCFRLLVCLNAFRVWPLARLPG